MPTYASTTTVPIERSRAEIERTLQRYGATGFMYGWEATRAMIGFVIGDRRYRIQLPLPDRNATEFTRTPARNTRRTAAAAEAAWEQATRQRWRALSLWIKAVLEAEEAGIVTVDEALQPFIVLPDGRTVGEWLAPQIRAVYQRGQMPRFLPGAGESDIVEGEVVNS